MHINKTAISLLTKLPKDPSQVIANMLSPSAHYMVARMFRQILCITQELMIDLLQHDDVTLYDLVPNFGRHLKHSDIIDQDAVHAWARNRDVACLHKYTLRERILRYELTRSDSEGRLSVLKSHAIANGDDEIYRLLPYSAHDINSFRVRRVSHNIPVHEQSTDAIFMLIAQNEQLAHTVCIHHLTSRFKYIPKLPLHVWQTLHSRGLELDRRYILSQTADVAQWIIDTIEYPHWESLQVDNISAYEILLRNNITTRTQNIDCAIMSHACGKMTPDELLRIARYSNIQPRHYDSLKPYVSSWHNNTGDAAWNRMVASVCADVPIDNVHWPELIKLPHGDHRQIIIQALDCDTSVGLRNILKTHTGPLEQVAVLAITKLALRCVRVLRDVIMGNPVLVTMACNYGMMTRH